MSRYLCDSEIIYTDEHESAVCSYTLEAILIKGNRRFKIRYREVPESDSQSFICFIGEQYPVVKGYDQIWATYRDGNICVYFNGSVVLTESIFSHYDLGWDFSDWRDNLFVGIVSEIMSFDNLVKSRIVI